MKKLIRNFLMSLGLLVAAACSSTATSTVWMSREEFRSATPEVRAAETSRKRELTVIDKEWEIVTLQSGEPVPFEFEGTGYTLQCHRFPGSVRTELAVYHGNVAPNWDRATHQSLAVYVGDENCVLVLAASQADKTVLVPIQIRNDSTAQSNFWRAFTLSATPGIAQAAGHGLAGEIFGNDCGGCAPTFNVQSVGVGGTATAGAISESNSGANVGVNVGVSGQCGSAACRPPGD